MIDCPFDDCLTFSADRKLTDHLAERHLQGRGPADELSLEDIAQAISDLERQLAAGVEILQLPRARKLLQSAALGARTEAELSLALVMAGVGVSA